MDISNKSQFSTNSCSVNVALVTVTKRCNIPEKKHEHRLQKDGIRIPMNQL